MTLQTKLAIDYYFGGFLHILLAIPRLVLSRVLLRARVPLHEVSDVTFVKLLGAGSLAIAYPALLELRRVKRLRSMRLVTSPALVPFAETLGIFDEVMVVRDKFFGRLLADSAKVVKALFLAEAIVDLELHSRLTTVLCLLTCASNRVGLVTRGSSWRYGLCTTAVSAEGRPLFEAYDELALMFGSHGVDWKSASATFSDHVRPTSRCRRKPQPRFAIAPCCSELSKARELTDSSWIAIIRRRLLQTGRRSACIHLFGGSSDRPRVAALAARIMEEMPTVRCFNHAARRDVSMSLKLLTRMDEAFCVDSGLLHFARLANVPTTSFWGPTNPALIVRPDNSGRHRTYYRQVPCSPCVHLMHKLPCGGVNVCIEQAAAEWSIETSDKTDCANVAPTLKCGVR